MKKKLMGILVLLTLFPLICHAQDKDAFADTQPHHHLTMNQQDTVVNIPMTTLETTSQIHQENYATPTRTYQYTWNHMFNGIQFVGKLCVVIWWMGYQYSHLPAN